MMTDTEVDETPAGPAGEPAAAETPAGEMPTEEMLAADPVEAAPANEPWEPTREQRLAYESVLEKFVPCSRCSFFFAGYRATRGRAALQAEIDRLEGNHLQLTWDGVMRQLIYKSYGTRIDQDAVQYRMACPECRRAFNYEAAAALDEPAVIEVELVPRIKRY